MAVICVICDIFDILKNVVKPGGFDCGLASLTSLPSLASILGGSEARLVDRRLCQGRFWRPAGLGREKSVDDDMYDEMAEPTNLFAPCADLRDMSNDDMRSYRCLCLFDDVYSVDYVSDDFLQNTSYDRIRLRCGHVPVRPGPLIGIVRAEFSTLHLRRIPASAL